MCSLPEEDFGTPDLLGSEQYELCTFANLDDFFQRIYRCAAQRCSPGSPAPLALLKVVCLQDALLAADSLTA